jgi:hypothetical protein
MKTGIKKNNITEDEYREEIKELKHELARLRRENRRLSQLVILQNNSGIRSSEAFAYQAAVHRLMNSSSYFSYLGSYIKSSSPYRIWNRLLVYSRRFRFFSTLLRMSARIVAFIEASAVLLLLSSAAIILIPVLLLVTLFTVLMTLLEGRKMLDEISGAIKGHRVYVFFPVKKKQLLPGSFYRGTLESLAADEHNIVIVVSPSILSESRSMFLSAKKKGERFYIIRRHFYFRLCGVLRHYPASAAYVY